MKRSLKILLSGLAIMLFIGFLLAQEEEKKEEGKEIAETVSGETPKVEKHWSKYVYPEELPAGAKVHIIEKGDTLWDLAGKYLGNPLLWPQIWEANKYITDAHWIYPGDPLIIPVAAEVPEEKIAAEMEKAPEEVSGVEKERVSEEAEEEVPEAQFAGILSKPRALISKGDVLCAGYIMNNFSQYKFRIFAAERQALAVSYSVNDIVYIDGGEAEGITAGDKFLILHPDQDVQDPETFAPIGTFVRKAGILTIIATQEHSSTAQIIQSCFPASIGDYLTPFEEPKVPVVTKASEIDRYAPIQSNLRGRIIFSENNTVGDHIVYIDRGSKDGVEVGSKFIIYRKYVKGYAEEEIKKEAPDTILGELVIIETQDNISIGKIILAHDYIMLGDLIALH